MPGEEKSRRVGGKDKPAGFTIPVVPNTSPRYKVVEVGRDFLVVEDTAGVG